MDRRDVNYYEAHAQTVILKDITSDEYNAAILEKLRDNDPKFTWLGIKVDEPDSEDDFLIQNQDDLGWLGYFVGRSKTLQYLFIDINDALSDRIGVFIEGLNQNQSIEKLYIGSDLGSKNFRRLNHFFLNDNNLRELGFCDMNNMGVESARSIEYMLSQCASLRKISFEDSNVNEQVLTEITKAISSHPQLEELDLSGNNLGREGCVALGNALKSCRNPQLQSLFLSYNVIDDGGLRSLVAGMKNCRNLTKLSLTGNEFITVDGFTYLSTLFQSDHCKLNLTHLYLDEMGIGDDEARAISAGLTNLHSLEELHVSYNDIGDDGADALAAGLVNLRSLEKLYLHGNSIGDEGAGALTAGVMDLQSLKALYLSHNAIGGRDLRSDSVVQEPTKISILETLHLGGNIFSLSGLISLGNLLQGTRTLMELYLCGCAIDDEGLQALAGGISNCYNLAHLDLSGNRSITTTGLTSLSSFLHSDECRLQYLCLDEINVDDDGALALANGLKGNNTLKTLSFRPTVSARLTSVGWSAFSKLLCNTSSVNNTYLSNHTLQWIGNYGSYGNYVKQLLEFNRQYSEGHAAIRKILKSYPDFDVEPFFVWNLNLLPLVASWFERISALAVDKSWESVDESMNRFEGRKLSTMYKFVRGLPLLVVDGYSSSKNAVHAPSRKRKLDQ